MIMIEKYNIIIILLLVLNGILVLVIEYLISHKQKCDSNLENISKLKKICAHGAAAANLYNIELSHYVESEREFIGNLLEIIKKNEKYYENSEIVAIINKFITDFEERVNNTNKLSSDILTNLDKIINEQEN